MKVQEYKNQNTETKLHCSVSSSFHHSPDFSAVSGQVSRNDAASAVSGDGASVEVVRRPRGRPIGSNNKPKPPVFLTRQPDPPQMCPYILEVSSGNDVVAAIESYCRLKGICVCILTVSGSVTNVTFRQPLPAAPGSSVTVLGKFDILSVSATILPPPMSAGSGEIPVSENFSVFLVGAEGQIVRGFVSGPLVATGSVYVVAACFNNTASHRLPIEE